MMDCARCRNFSNFHHSFYSRDFFVEGKDEFHGSLVDSSRYVASTRTSSRRFHVDSLQVSAGESVEKKEKKTFVIRFSIGLGNDF